MATAWPVWLASAQLVPAAAALLLRLVLLQRQAKLRQERLREMLVPAAELEPKVWVYLYRCRSAGIAPRA